MASLVDLTKRVASVPGKIASNIGGVVKGSVMRSTGINQITPSNIFAATLEAAGLESLIPASLGLFGGGGGGKPTKQEKQEKASQIAASGQRQGSSNMDQLIRELLDVNYRILNTSREILSETKEQRKSLDQIAGYFKGKEMSDIEDRREKKQIQAPPAADKTPKQQDGKGGLFSALGGMVSGLVGFLKNLGSIFGSILKFVPTILSAAGSLLGFFGKIGGFFIDLIKMIDFGKILGFLAPVGRFFTSLLGFLGRFAGPIAAVLGVLLSLEQQDWTAFFKKFTDAWDAFLKGDWLTALVNVVTAIPELLIKGIGRLLANIIEFFGFKDAARAINEFLDNFDLAKTIIDGIKYIGNLIVDGFNAVKDTFKKFWDSFNIIDPIVDAFNYVKDAVVNFFGSIKDSVANVISGAGDIASSIGSTISNMVSSVWNFFKAIPAKIGEMISSIIPEPLKGLWNKIFGSSKAAEEPAAATPIPSAGAPGPAGAAGEPGKQQYIENNQTFNNTTGQQQNNPAPTSQPFGGRLAGYAQQAREAAPQNRLLPQSEARTKAISAILAQTPENIGGENIKQTPVFQAVSEENERQQKANEAARLGMNQTNNQPVVINGGSQQQAPQPQATQSKENRTSGAAMTAPVQSHMDRALYGSGFGAGVP